MSRIQWLFHFIAYYASWIACIYYAAHGVVWTGPLIAFACLLAQIFWQNHWNRQWQPALFFATLLTLLAILIDSLLMYWQWILFEANPFANRVPPPWMIMMWLSFGFNLILLSKKWLHLYLLWGFLILTGLPFAYYLGVAAGAATVTTPVFYLLLGCIWMILLPQALYLFNHFARHRA